MFRMYNAELRRVDVAAETKSLVRSAAAPPPPPVVVEPKPPEVPEGSLADEVHRLAAKLVAVTRGPLEEPGVASRVYPAYYLSGETHHTSSSPEPGAAAASKASMCASRRS